MNTRDIKIVNRRLSQGYGVFDIEVMDKISPATTRVVIDHHTKAGTLLSLMGVKKAAPQKAQAAQ